MKTRLFIYLLFLGGFVPGLHAQITQPAVQETEIFDQEALFLIQKEMVQAKNILLDIRNSQNPATLEKTLNSFSVVLKEFLYMVGSGAVVGSGIVGLAVLFGVNAHTFNRNDSPIFIGTLLVGMPVTIISLILSYVSLKLIFEKLLASSDPANKLNSKEALSLIDKTVNKLDYEIKKIERILRQQKTQPANC